MIEFERNKRRNKVIFEEKIQKAFPKKIKPIISNHNVEDKFPNLVEEFPLEIIQHTTSFLDSSSFLSLSLSNKEWNNICFHHETFWKNLFQSTGNSTKSNQQTWRQSYFHYIKYLKKLSEERDNLEIQLKTPCSISEGECDFMRDDFFEFSYTKISVDLEETYHKYEEFELKIMKDEKIDEEYVKRSMFRYEKFMELTMKYPDVLLIPTQDIEMIWISHLLKPLEYVSDCQKHFKKIIPHSLTLGDFQILMKQKSFEDTKTLWEKEFGFPYGGEYNHVKIEKSFRLSSYKDTIKDIRDSTCFIVAKNIHSFEVPSSFQFKFSLTAEEILNDRKYFEKISQNHKVSKKTSYFNPDVVSYFSFWDLLMKKKEEISKYSPDYEIDVFWHTHMLHPQEYLKDCLNSFGFLLNHTSIAEKKVGFIADECKIQEFNYL
jgi:hypothetical protein